MEFFSRKEFTSLSDAVENAGSCKILSMNFIDFNLKDLGKEFSKLTNLKSLYIQGSNEIFDLPDFKLPPEIGALSKLESISFLNLPINHFPDWIANLSKLKYLMLRGTDVTSIPEFIATLKNLKILRVENCPLAELPFSLRHMNNLKELGLCDNTLLDFSHESFPKKLSELNLVGTPHHNKPAFDKLKIALRKTRIFPV